MQRELLDQWYNKMVNKSTAYFFLITNMMYLQ